MTPSDLEARLQLITKAAPGLRKAGVTGVTIGDVEFDLAPLEPELDADALTDPTTTPDQPDDPMKDPDLHGGETPRRRGTPAPPGKDRDPWPAHNSSGGKPQKAKRTS